MYKFYIENKAFTVPKDFSKLDEFIVNSIPQEYNITIKNDSDIFKEVQKLLDENKGNIVLIDEKVYNIYFKKLNIEKSRLFLAKATEKFKTLKGVEDVVVFLEKNEFTKSEKLIVIGGGIIEDVGAFVGACYKRGIKWIYYPTTLLSMCDSCIGGKTGINYNNVKNQLALFSSPYEVRINLAFLTTLSEYDIKSGIGEVLKLLITGGKDLLNIYLKKVQIGKVKRLEGYRFLILASLSVKKAVVEEDEFELYYRKSLNYGHTIGHAVEVLSDYKIPHGQAVIIGIIIVNKLFQKRGVLNNEDYNLIKKLSIEVLGEDFTLKNIPLNGLDKLLKKDKKTEGSIINFVAISSLGNTKFLKLELSESLIQEIGLIITQEF
ncbi:MAG: 3-dehydroquinate synthase [Endomicrobium sp.]|nr:3-dehydroquinate synthase [Endomicrobium sp.]